MNIGVLIPLLLSAGILLAGNGLLGTLIAVRGTLEGFGPTIIGFTASAYFVGYILGCLVGPRLVRRAGHIRTFAGLAAVAAIAVLTMILIVDVWVWMGARLITGLCFASLSMVVESWLNERAGSAYRGRVLSLYRVVDLTAVTGSQFLLPLVGAGGFEIFVLTGMLFCLAIVPVSLSRQTAPSAPQAPGFDPLLVWRVSPVAAMGCFAIGLTNAAYRTVGPVYAQTVNLSVDQVALFMAAGIVGGTIAQYPLGWLSDRVGRRAVLIGCTVGSAIAGAVLTLAGETVNAVYAGSFLFGAFALPLYSLSVAHANDFAPKGRFVELSAALILTFSVGAVIGPLLASATMNVFGGPAFFTYTSIVHLAFLAFILYRRTKRPEVTADRRTRFVVLLRTSPAIFGLARSGRDERGTDEAADADKDDAAGLSEKPAAETPEPSAPAVAVDEPPGDRRG